MSSRVVYVVIYIRISFLFKGWNIFYFVYIKHHILFVFSFIDGHLIYFYLWLLWMCCYELKCIISVWASAGISLGHIYISRNGIIGSYGNSVFAFLRSTVLSSTFYCFLIKHFLNIIYWFCVMVPDDLSTLKYSLGLVYWWLPLHISSPHFPLSFRLILSKCLLTSPWMLSSPYAEHK